ncbi:hypothetical protein DES52_10655 [Deinococcus yavapaiensis KR-236]|uniref:Transposase IS30-like HTH domain-containing protein n=1 Tax=Deinococcus yavapaiensis KR-236 TaxID=694435 RepID=A0A318S606_9DEIO|nr:hypothetical protein DES52_10655 [Deinococcus yavapaiensis KR-236]
MPPLPVEKHLDVLEHLRPRLRPRLEHAPIKKFALQSAEKAFYDSIVPTIPLSAHARHRVHGPQFLLVDPAGILGEFKWSSQHLEEMGWDDDQEANIRSSATRRLGSHGRPRVARREDQRRFWALIAQGLQGEDAARSANVSPAVGVRWFREAGGMPPATLAPRSDAPTKRYLSFAEREEIALCRVQGRGVRDIARHLIDLGTAWQRAVS